MTVQMYSSPFWPCHFCNLCHRIIAASRLEDDRGEQQKQQKQQQQQQKQQLIFSLASVADQQLVE